MPTGYGFRSSILRYFCPCKKFLFWTHDVIACDLWFGPPQSKTMATPMLRSLLYLLCTVRLERSIRWKVRSRRYSTHTKFVLVALCFSDTVNFWSTQCSNFERTVPHSHPCHWHWTCCVIVRSRQTKIMMAKLILFYDNCLWLAASNNYTVNSMNKICRDHISIEQLKSPKQPNRCGFLPTRYLPQRKMWLCEYHSIYSDWCNPVTGE